MQGTYDSKGRFIPILEYSYSYTPLEEASVETTPSIEASPVVPAPARVTPSPDADPLNWLPWVGAGTVASAGALVFAGFFFLFNARVEKDGALIARTRIKKGDVGRICVLSGRVTNKIIPGWKTELPKGTGAQIIKAHKFELVPRKSVASKGGPLSVSSKVGEVGLYRGSIAPRIPLGIKNVYSKGDSS